MSSIKINELPLGIPNNNSLFVFDNSDLTITQKTSLEDIINFAHNGPNFTNINVSGSITFTNTPNNTAFIRMNQPSGQLAITSSTFPVSAGDGPIILLKGDATGTTQQIEIYTKTPSVNSTDAAMLVFPSGAPNRVGIFGNVIANSFEEASDSKFKENIIPLSGCLDLINQLNPVQFNFISNSPLNHHNYTTVGFLAQEVEEVFDNLPYNKGITKHVSISIPNSNQNIDFISLNEINLISILTQAIKELTEKVNVLQLLLNNS